MKTNLPEEIAIIVIVIDLFFSLILGLYYGAQTWIVIPAFSMIGLSLLLCIIGSFVRGNDSQFYDSGRVEK